MIDAGRPDFTNTPVSDRRPVFGYGPASTDGAPLVTIVTPFYNTSAVFEETARSVLHQSFQQWEWLIVNDGSTSAEALTILASYRRGDPRIRVIDHLTNRGLSAARNTGFREARAEYLVQLDSDDLLEPTAVEKWFWFLESHPESAFCKGYSVGFGAQSYLWTRGFHEGAAFLDENLVDATSMVRTRVHRAVDGYDETNLGGFEDWDFWLRCASHGFWGGTIPEYLNWYRRRDEQEKRWSNLGAPDQFKAELRTRYAHLWERFPGIPGKAASHVSVRQPAGNRLQKDVHRVVLLTGGGPSTSRAAAELELVRRLATSGWEVTVVALASGEPSCLSRMSQCTPDVFVMDHFLRPVDFPDFLHYLLQSRQADVVLLACGEFGYSLLPFLGWHCPGVVLADLVDEGDRLDCDDMASFSASGFLDWTIAATPAVATRLVAAGADADRVQTSDVGQDRDDAGIARVLDRLIVARAASPHGGRTLDGEWVAEATRRAVLTARVQLAEHQAAATEGRLTELQVRSAELQTAKDWLDKEWRNESARRARLEESLLVRISRRLGLIHDSVPAGHGDNGRSTS